MAAFQYVKRVYKKVGDKLFSRVCCDRTRGNGFRLKVWRFRLDMRKKFFTISVVRQWNRLPREVVDAPSLETFKVKLDEQPHLAADVPVHCRGDPLMVIFNSSDAMILQFCDSKNDRLKSLT